MLNPGTKLSTLLGHTKCLFVNHWAYDANEMLQVQDEKRSLMPLKQHGLRQTRGKQSLNDSSFMHAEQAFLFFFLYKNNNTHLAVVASTAFDLFSRMQWTRRMKKENAMQTKWEAQCPTHISSLLTGLRLTPGILIKVYVQVSVRVAFLKKMKEIG